MPKGPYKTHCKRGHEYTRQNTIWNTSSPGRKTRKCRTCASLFHKTEASIAASRAKDNAKRRAASINRQREKLRLMEHVAMECHFFDPTAIRGSGSCG